MMALVFAILATFAMLCALGAFFQSLRAAFGAAQESSLRLATDDAHSAVLAEKDAVLGSIKDLEFDRALDKVSEKDFAILDKQLRARARAVLRVIDEDTAQHRQQAKKLIDAHLAKMKVTPDAAPYRDASTASQVCAKCDTTNDVDARFCKRCAAPLESAQQTSEEHAKVDAPKLRTKEDEDALQAILSRVARNAPNLPSQQDIDTLMDLVHRGGTPTEATPELRAEIEKHFPELFSKAEAEPAPAPKKEDDE